MAHGNFPNSSKNQARFVQYIKYNAVDEGVTSQIVSQLQMCPELEKALEGQEFSEEGKKLFGFEKW